MNHIHILSALAFSLFALQGWAQNKALRIWSDTPAFTQLFNNQKEVTGTSDSLDGVFQGDPVFSLPRIKNPSAEIYRWHQGEGTNWLNEETFALTHGRYPNPVRIWENEPFPIGNGRLAASVFHGSGRDRYALNEVSFWSGGMNRGTINAMGDKSFDKENGPEINENGFGGSQPVGDLIVDFGHPVQKDDFVRSLCMDRGVVCAEAVRQGVKVSSEAFSSYPDQVMVLHYKAHSHQGLNAFVSFATQRGEDRVSVGQNTLQLDSRLANGMQCRTLVDIRCSGGSLLKGQQGITIQNADSCTFVIAIETNYVMDFKKIFRNDAFGETLTKRIEQTRNRSYADLYAVHAADYQQLFNRQSIVLQQEEDGFLNLLPTHERLAVYRSTHHDVGLENTLYNFGRYLMISTSRPGSLPAGLQGIWNGMVRAPWGNDYHSNINFQMVYWLPEVGNLSECHKPMIDYLYAMREPNRLATQDYLKALKGTDVPMPQGWIVYTSHNPFGGHGWQVNLPGSAWYGLHMWEHYAFTQDKEYLKKEAYPMMKELCQYWEKNLKTLGTGAKGFQSNYKDVDVSQYPELASIKEGTLVIPNGWSPEIGPRGEDGVSHDQEIISELFGNTIKAARILGTDKKWINELEAKRNRLYYPRIGKKGNLMEWMIDRDPVTDHRHTSHLFALFPGSGINMESTPELAEAALKSLQFRKNSGNSNRAFTWAWRCQLWARLHNGNKSHEMIENLMTHNMLNNLFTTQNLPLQIDGNYGIASAMLEMLIQSHAGVIELLPALPDAWKKGGSIKGGKARGNIEVDLTWKDGKVIQWALHSAIPQQVKVKVNGEYIDYRTSISQ